MARIPSDLPVEELDAILPQLVDKGLPGGGEFLLAELGQDERTATVIAILIWHGFLPMGGMGMLLPKIHLERCVLAPSEMHVGRKVRRRAKGYRLSVDTAWQDVVRGIQEHTYTDHKGDCWLSDKLAQAYEEVGKLSEGRRRGVSFHSVELWHVASNELVAGEIGYTSGSIYTSCTGFTLKVQHPGAGSVQIASLGRWLCFLGFALWDLGMELDYKLELGGRSIARAEWATRVRALRSPADRGPMLTSPPEDSADADGLVAGAAAAVVGEQDAAAPPAAVCATGATEHTGKVKARRKNDLRVTDKTSSI